MEQSPEARLWISVIIDAILEASSPTGNPASVKGRREDLGKREALNFLTDQTGGWAESREEICDLVDICPERLRKEFQAIIDRGTSRSEILSMVDGLSRKAQKTTEGKQAA